MIAATQSSVLIASISTLVTAVVALAVVLGRTRERLARLEEWVRQYERKNGRNRE